MRKVLIDTWWNVNEVIAALIVSLPGFNRYMVECELHPPKWLSGLRSVLIDTWWNVNHDAGTHLSTAIIPVLIDTWWNVN